MHLCIPPLLRTHSMVQHTSSTWSESNDWRVWNVSLRKDTCGHNRYSEFHHEDGGPGRQVLDRMLMLEWCTGVEPDTAFLWSKFWGCRSWPAAREDLLPCVEPFKVRYRLYETGLHPKTEEFCAQLVLNIYFNIIRPSTFRSRKWCLFIYARRGVSVNDD
jgi:hypothetical protein